MPPVVRRLAIGAVAAAVVIAGVVCVALLATTAVNVPAGEHANTTTEGSKQPLHGNRSAAPWGITVKSGAELRQRIDQIGYVPVYAAWFEGWSDGKYTFRADLAAEISAAGSIPMVTWEPKAAGRPGGPEQKSYLPGIIRGDWDPYIRRYARAVKGHEGEVVIRFAHEANIDAYSWGVNRHGNSADDYIQAWRHVVTIFRKEGVTNAKFFWTPNVPFPGRTAEIADVYPGSDWVDMAGVDGYNWGGARWVDPTDLFSLGVEQVREVAPDKPLWIGETSSAEGATPEAKPHWIESFFALLSTDERIDGFVWLDEDIEHDRDWRLDTSEASFEAFRRGLTDFTPVMTTNLIEGTRGHFDNGSTAGWTLTEALVRPLPGTDEYVLPAQGTGYFRGTAEPDAHGSFLTTHVRAGAAEELVASVHVASSSGDHDYLFTLTATPLDRHGKALSDPASASRRGDWRLRWLATPRFATPAGTEEVRIDLSIAQRGDAWGTVMVDDARLTKFT